MRDRLVIAGVVTLAALLLFLLAGAFPVGHDDQLVIFKTPAFLAAVALGALLMLLACFQRRPLLRQAAFVLTHAGLVLLLAGAVTGWMAGVRYDGIRLPVMHGHAIGKLRNPGGDPVDLGFALAVTNFTVDTYDPVYALFRPLVPQPTAPADYAFVRDVDPRVPASLARTPAGAIDAAQLRPDGRWLPELTLENGWLLQKRPDVPRWYEAAVLITRPDAAAESRVLAVNHPLTINGWRIFLVSYGLEPIASVELAFKREPGLPLVTGGIWCVIAGVTLFGFFMPPPAGKENRHAAG